MPTYDYECQHCHIIYEVFQKMSDDKLTKCDYCGQDALVRLISASKCIMDASQPKTLGDLADKNTERMVKEGKLHKSHLNHQENKRKKQSARQHQNDLANMSKDQKIKYIFEGKK